MMPSGHHLISLPTLHTNSTSSAMWPIPLLDFAWTWAWWECLAERWWRKWHHPFKIQHGLKPIVNCAALWRQHLGDLIWHSCSACVQREAKSCGTNRGNVLINWSLPNPSDPWILDGSELRTVRLSSPKTQGPTSPLPPHSPSHRLPTTHQKKRLLLTPTVPKLTSPVPPSAGTCPGEPLCSFYVPCHSKLLPSSPTWAISRNKASQAPPPPRREATTATSVRSPRRSGAVTLQSVQPGTEQAGAPGRGEGLAGNNNNHGDTTGTSGSKNVALPLLSGAEHMDSLGLLSAAQNGVALFWQTPFFVFMTKE